MQWMDKWTSTVEPKLQAAHLSLVSLQTLSVACATHSLLVLESEFWADVPTVDFHKAIASMWDVVEGKGKSGALKKISVKLEEAAEEEEEDFPDGWIHLSDALIHAVATFLGDDAQESAVASMAKSYDALLEEEIALNMQSSEDHQGSDPTQVIQRLQAMQPGEVEPKSRFLSREIEFQLECIATLGKGVSMTRKDIKI